MAPALHASTISVCLQGELKLELKLKLKLELELKQYRCLFYFYLLGAHRRARLL